MPDPQYNLTNPDWDHKEISDLQTATEMNQVIGAFKNNIVRLNALINLLNPDLALTTVAQTYSAAINELAVKLNLQWLNLANQYDVIPYPAMLKGQTRVCRIYEQGTNTEVENGWAIIGGNNGEKIGNKAMLICMQDSAGGTHAEVGFKYAIIGNNISKQQLITVADHAHLPDEPDAIKDAIYLTIDTGNLYFWSAELSNFIQIGSIIEGTLISETEFKDTNNVVVVPDGTHIYKDQGSGVYYKWNGVKYEVFNQTGGGGTITDAMVILEDMYPGLGITQDWQRNQRALNQAIVGKLTDSMLKSIYDPNNIEKDVFNRANHINLTYDECLQDDAVTGTFAFDMTALKGSYILTMTGNTTFSVTNTETNVSRMFSFYLSGNKIPTFSGMTKDPASDDYDGSGQNLVWVEVSKGSTTTKIMYGIKNLS